MPMNEEEARRLAELEASLRAVTDQVGRILDQVQQKGYVPAFRCGHSGLYFPADYIKEWGRTYGIGLGEDPRSEVLDSDYETPPPEITPDIRRIEQIMHPLRHTRAQVDMVLVPPAEYTAGRAVVAEADPDVEQRARIVRAKQLVNPKSGLKVMEMKWAQLGRRV